MWEGFRMPSLQPWLVRVGTIDFPRPEDLILGFPQCSSRSSSHKISTIFASNLDTSFESSNLIGDICSESDLEGINSLKKGSRD
jgi:hypothetical protein